MDDVFPQDEGAEQRNHIGEFLITAAFNKNLLLDLQLMLFVSLKPVSDDDPTLTVATFRMSNRVLLQHFLKVLSQNMFCQHSPDLNALECRRSKVKDNETS